MAKNGFALTQAVSKSGPKSHNCMVWKSHHHSLCFLCMENHSKM